jgi:hypothetical protein
MKARQVLSLVTLSVLLAALVAATAPNAAANHIGNPEVGPYDQANVWCTSAAWSFSSEGTISAAPQVGAAPKYQWQAVGWVIYIKNLGTGAGFYLQPGGVPDWEYHQRVSGGHITHLTPGTFRTKSVAPGRYEVQTKYYWYTSRGWVDSEWVTNRSYMGIGGTSTSCNI